MRTTAGAPPRLDQSGALEGWPLRELFGRDDVVVGAAQQGGAVLRTRLERVCSGYSEWFITHQARKHTTTTHTCTHTDTAPSRAPTASRNPNRLPPDDVAAAFGVDGVGFPLDGRSLRAIAARIACLSSSSTFASVFDDDDDGLRLSLRACGATQCSVSHFESCSRTRR